MTSESSPEWLPAGWIMQTKVSESGRKVKCYVDPASGCKLYSRPQVSRYLETANSGKDPQTGITANSGNDPQTGITSVNDTLETNESPEWLPHGWIVESRTRNSGSQSGKKFKIYVDPASGCKFYSKPQVFQYLKKINSGRTPVIGITTSNNNAVETNESPEWLPDGWIVKSKTVNGGVKSGRKFKMYIDPTTGCKFYSKPQVCQHVEKMKSGVAPQICPNAANDHSINHSTGGGTSSKPNVPQNCTMNNSCISEEKKLHCAKQLTSNVMIENVSDDDFPSGWTKEIRARKNPKQKDVYYVDPASGYLFLSKPDALRYLKSGEISSCKIKPKRRDSSVVDLMNNDSTHSLDHITGGRTSSNPVVPLNNKTNQSSVPEQEKFDGVSRAMNNVVVESVSVEELPPGWIKETRTRKIANRTVKDPYYTDPVSGYMFRSKPDAIRFLKTGDINSCKIKPKRRDVDDPDLANNDISERHSLEHSIGQRTSSNPDVSQNSKTNQTRISESESETKKFDGGNQAVDNVAVERVPVEELPPGWIKETRTRKLGNRTVKDPFYIDPVTGYIFHSKPDVLRYLETGDINSCKMKPKKRDTGDREFMNDNDDISPSSVVGGKTSSKRTRRCSSGEQYSNKSLSDSIVAPEVGSSEERKKNASAANMDVSLPTISSMGANQTKESSIPVSEPFEKEQIKYATEIVANVVNDIMQEEQLSENEILKPSKAKNERSNKSKNKKVLNPPSRSSKRLAGLKLEMPPDNSLNKRARQAADRNADEIDPSPLILNVATHEASQQLEVQTDSTCKETVLHYEESNKIGELVDQTVPTEKPEKQDAEEHINDKPRGQVAANAFHIRETTSEVESLNRWEKEPQEVVPGNGTTRQEAAEQINGDRPELRDLPPDNPFMDAWTDPCLEFAFKTLTGAMPVEENLSVDDCFQQQPETPQTQTVGCSLQTESAISSFLQNDGTSATKTTEKPVPIQQLPSNLQSGNARLPSYNSISPQQSGLESGNK